jgi:hypothetical protein
MNQDTEKIKTSAKIIEENSNIKLIEEDPSSLAHNLFKKNVLVDLETIPNLEEVQIGDLSGIPETLNNAGVKTINTNPIIESSSTPQIIQNKVSNGQSILLQNPKILSFFNHDNMISQLERKYRKVPYCFTCPTNVMSLYTFSNSDTGLLCAESLSLIKHALCSMKDVRL